MIMWRLLCCVLAAACLAQAADAERRLTYAQYLDKVRGGWMGKVDRALS